MKAKKGAAIHDAYIVKVKQAYLPKNLPLLERASDQQQVEQDAKMNTNSKPPLSNRAAMMNNPSNCAN